MAMNVDTDTDMDTDMNVDKDILERTFFISDIDSSVIGVIRYRNGLTGTVA